ncbi:hypothetical protein [Mycobacterium sp. URHB0044]|uniref:hypothetical protein n=1 Tax=Mycobacterium sp. URHB0044 TaxID=1380386 RepID=UPI0012DBF6F3|nr:hypothetical protein [Mycobacterium sp. URHB0044]
MAAFWQIEYDKDSHIYMFLASKKPIERKVDVTVSIIDKDFDREKFSCKSGGTSGQAKVGEINEGTKIAAQWDASQSELAGRSGSLSKDTYEDAQAYTYVTQLKPRHYFKGWTTSWDAAEGEVVDCTFKKDSIWKASGASSSALVPKLEFTNSENKPCPVDTVYTLASVSFTRTPGSIVTESYPQLSPLGTQLLGELASFRLTCIAYTDLPTIIVSNRSTSRSDTLILTFAGISLGFVGALFIYVLDVLYDLTIGRKIDRE